MRSLSALLVTLLVSIPLGKASAGPNYLVWSIAHERMVAGWRCAEPRCGWTVGGYTCSSRATAASSQRYRARY
jgi:hypothetical protein